MMRTLAFAMAVLGTSTFIPARAEGPDDSQIYQQVMDSVFLVANPNKNGVGTHFGSGVLIDAERGFVLTAHHVIGEAKAVAIFPPVRDARGEIINDPDYYLSNHGRLAVICTVIEQDPKRDLALLRMLSRSTGRAIPIAVKSAKPGQSLLCIGNSVSRRDDKLTGVLWRFSGGSVRQVYTDKYHFDDGQEIAATVLAMSVPVNPGDSGGPTVNHRGELVGITSATMPEENQNYKAIDVVEIWTFLRKPDREISFTLFDPAQSSTSGPTRTLAYQIVSTKGLEATSKLTHRFKVNFDAAGELSVSRVEAEK